MWESVKKSVYLKPEIDKRRLILPAGHPCEGILDLQAVDAFVSAEGSRDFDLELCNVGLSRGLSRTLTTKVPVPVPGPPARTVTKAGFTTGHRRPQG